MKPLTGNTVRVHYTGTLTDGSMFDSSEGREPLEFVVGEGMVIPGFDDAVADLEVGGKTTVTIPCDEAYGARQDEMVSNVPLEFFGEEKPEVGWMLQLQSPEGQIMPATVVAVTDEEATLDLNHPLAGQDLTFVIELVEIVPEEEVAAANAAAQVAADAAISAFDDTDGTEDAEHDLVTDDEGDNA